METGEPRPVRIFISSTPDMVREREALHEWVWPRLRARAEPLGIAVEFVDPRWRGAGEPPPDETRLLPASLAGIDACRPYFIGLLGDRYGLPAADPPPELLGEYPWLAGCAGRSVTELELRYGALDLPELSRNRIYLRDPAFAESLPQAERWACLEQPTPEEIGRLGFEAALARAAEREAKLADLKTRIQAIGSPILEPYRDPEALGASVLTYLARVVLEPPQPILAGAPDLASPARAPTESLPAPDTGAPAAAGAPVYLDENVQFTVYRPRVVRPRRWYPMLAFAHLSERRPEAAPDEPDPVEEVQRQARQALGAQIDEYADLTQDSRLAVPREGELTFVPEVAGIEFNPPRRSFLWIESVHREEFRLRADAALDGQTARGRLTVLLGTILLAEVVLSIRVDSRHEATAQTAPVVDGARPYRKIFASYSHRDVAIVREFERFARATGDEYLRDVIHLRAGEVWSDRLRWLIERADVFQLFWSSNAMRSPYVRQEWEHALALGRPSFVRPVYWEEPMPRAPQENLPPPVLSRLHFCRVDLPGIRRPAEPPSQPALSVPPVQAPTPATSASMPEPRAEPRYPAPVPQPAAPGGGTLLEYNPAVWVVIAVVAILVALRVADGIGAPLWLRGAVVVAIIGVCAALSLRR